MNNLVPRSYSVTVTEMYTFNRLAVECLSKKETGKRGYTKCFIKIHSLSNSNCLSSQMNEAGQDVTGILP